MSGGVVSARSWLPLHQIAWYPLEGLMSNRPFLWAEAPTTPSFQSLLSPTNTCTDGQIRSHGHNESLILSMSHGTDLPVVASRVEALLGDDAWPDVESLLTVSVELQFLTSLHLLPVLGEDKEWIRRHWVQRNILWKQPGRQQRANTKLKVWTSLWCVMITAHQDAETLIDDGLIRGVKKAASDKRSTL